jgi:hypothetical protein
MGRKKAQNRLPALHAPTIGDQQPMGEKMADIYDVLYCFACEEHAILVKRRASKTATARCDNCGAENEIGKILNAMKLKGIVMPPPRWTH